MATLGWFSPCSLFLLPSSQASNKWHHMVICVSNKSHGDLIPSSVFSDCKFPGYLYRESFLGKHRLEIIWGDQEGSQASDTFKQGKRSSLFTHGTIRVCRTVINSAAHWRCLFHCTKADERRTLEKRGSNSNGIWVSPLLDILFLEFMAVINKMWPFFHTGFSYNFPNTVL